jgi:predicted nucleic acid-binding protein
MASVYVVLDSGALSALAQSRESVRRFLEAALDHNGRVVVPAVVIAESTTGTARDAAVNRALRAIEIVPITERIARDAAALRYRVRRSPVSVIDAIVVATADQYQGAALMTGDPDDLGKLARVRDRTVVVPIKTKGFATFIG